MFCNTTILNLFLIKAILFFGFLVIHFFNSDDISKASFPSNILLCGEAKASPLALAIAAFTFLPAKKFERKARHGRLTARGTPKKYPVKNIFSAFKNKYATEHPLYVPWARTATCVRRNSN